jgi:hypothetical protein
MHDCRSIKPPPHKHAVIALASRPQHCRCQAHPRKHHPAPLTPSTPSQPPTPPKPSPSPPQGFDLAKTALLAFLDEFKESVDGADRELLRCVARTSLRTKLHEALADQLTDIVTDAVLCIRKPDTPIDLYMVSRRQRGGGHGCCVCSSAGAGATADVCVQAGLAVQAVERLISTATM